MNASDFALAEYQSLRSEIIAQQGRRDLLLQLGIGAIGLVFAWLATHTVALARAPDSVEWAVWFVPAAIAFFGLLKQLSITFGVRKAAIHLAMLQESIADRGEAGWELRLVLNSPEAKSVRKSLCDVDMGDSDVLAELWRRRVDRIWLSELWAIGKYPRDVDKIIWSLAFVVSLPLGIVGAARV